MTRVEAISGTKKKTAQQESEDWERAEIERLKRDGAIPADVVYQRKGST